MEPFHIALILATFLCSLVAGFLFAFAIVVMPGIRRLDDREFIRAFQVMDGIIQDNQPLFVVVWLGSILAVITTAVLGVGGLDTAAPWLVIVATLAYLLGVQLPTFTINIPLNRRLQSLEIDAMDEAAARTGREGFEARWNRWNAIRTVVACLVSALLIAVVAGY